jgi:multidrug efflux pump subunit AcrA (membrane-fusion protein)
VKAASFVLGLALLLAVGCGSKEQTGGKDGHGHGSEEGHKEGQVKLDAEQQKIAGIEITRAKLSTSLESLNAPGVVQSTTSGRALVTPPVAGRLLSLQVQLGSNVKQGQVIGVLESSDLAASWGNIAEVRRNRDAASSVVKDAKASFNLATNKVTAAKANLERQKQFVAAGAYNQAPLQQAQSELNDAQSELLSLQKEQATHAEQYRRLENLFRDGLVSRSDMEAAKLELQQDEIKVTRVKAKIDNAKQTYDREKNIAQKGLVNARELQTAEAEVRAAALERERAKISLNSAESALRNSEKAIQNAQSAYRTTAGGAGASGAKVNIVAPISGVVTSLAVTQGQAVDRTQSLCEIENLSSVWVTASIPEKDASKVIAGAPVRVTLPALPGAEFIGSVQIVGSRIDPKTRAIPVQCIIQNAKGRLKPDMFATVHLGIGTSVQAISVPISALVQEDGKSFVFVKTNEAFEKRSVTLGSRSDGQVVILDGLKVDEEFAVKGGFVLASEQKKDELKGHED